MLDAIQTIEGFAKGKEQFIERDRVIDTERGKKGALEKFQLKNGGWLTKSEIVPLVVADKIINAVYVRQNGSSYVRSKPDQTNTNNFSIMAES